MAQRRKKPNNKSPTQTQRQGRGRGKAVRLPNPNRDELGRRAIAVVAAAAAARARSPPLAPFLFLLRRPIDLDRSASVCNFLLWISTKLIDQLARDDEKIKKKTRKPKPKKTVKQHQQEPQDNSRELPASEPKAPPGWPLQPPMYLPVTPAPPPPPPAFSELEAIRAVLEESEKVQEKLDKQHAGMRDELIKKSKDLRDKEFKLPYQNPTPCTEERSNCRQCYVSNAQDPLKCAEAVKRFEACVRLARQRGNTKVAQ
uniref:Uncharacterized protein n=1 Tax=Oryza nivara TaxID=4536 RepID=A0A0E0H8A7_ORYNI